MGATPAFAGPLGDVASAFDADDGFDLHLSVEYILDVRTAAIKRENAGQAGVMSGDPMPVVKDLVFSSTRHTLLPRLELGVFTDVAIMAALPVVISDTRLIEFDQRQSNCVFTGMNANCTDRTNSLTIADGLLSSTGFDSDDPGGPGFTDTSDPAIFRGPKRYGLDQLFVGITIAPMNQARDESKPTWKIGTELRLAIAAAAQFDRNDPKGNTAVGRGVSELRLWTSMAKRVRWAEPYVELWWQAPVGQTDDSPFKSTLGDFGQVRVEAQQSAGTRFGFEAVAWEEPKENNRVSVDFEARLEAHFEGRAYSEMWEIFQYAGDPDFTPIAGQADLVLDSDPVLAGKQPLAHPGISNVENYIRFGGKLGIGAELGDKVRFAASFALRHDQSHLITNTDAGIDSPLCGAGVTGRCENDDNDVVNPGTEEVNPYHVKDIDVVGSRYRIDEVTDYVVAVDARILF